MNVHQKWIMRYANCWEDADLLIKYIADSPGKKLLSVASGGENSLSLLCTDPQEVWVADINPLQLYVFELKMRGIEHLELEVFLRFAGYRNCNSEKRVKIYHSIKPYLSADAAKYWDAYMHQLKNGFIYAGRLEKNLRFFAKYIRPLIHSHKTSANLLAQKPQPEQVAFYCRYWNTLRWKMIFRLFFSKTMLKFIAPDPTFFNYVKGDITKYLYNKLANHLQSEAAQKNHILHFALFGNFGNILPHYVQQGNYETIKNRIGRIKMFHGSVEEIFKLGYKFDGFNLSNIFEYTKTDEFKEFAGKLLAGGEKNAKYVYWNLMLPRKISDIFPQKTISELDSSQSENFDDKGLIYFRMCVDKKF